MKEINKMNLDVFNKATELFQKSSFAFKKYMFWKDVEIKEFGGIKVPVCMSSPFSENPCLAVDMIFPAHTAELLSKYQETDDGSLIVTKDEHDAVIHLPTLTEDKTLSDIFKGLWLQRFSRYFPIYKHMTLDDVPFFVTPTDLTEDLIEKRADYLEKHLGSFIKEYHTVARDSLALLHLAKEYGHQFAALQLEDNAPVYAEYVIKDGCFYWVNTFGDTSSRRGNKYLLLLIAFAISLNCHTFNMGRYSMASYKGLWTKAKLPTYSLRKA